MSVHEELAHIAPYQLVQYVRDNIEEGISDKLAQLLEELEEFDEPESCIDMLDVKELYSKLPKMLPDSMADKEELIVWLEEKVEEYERFLEGRSAPGLPPLQWRD